MALAANSGSEKSPTIHYRLVREEAGPPSGHS